MSSGEGFGCKGNSSGGQASKLARLNLRPDERMLGFGERKERKEGRKENPNWWWWRA
jgi:hypothetical protein